MEIKIDKLMPTPLASISHSEESIWGNSTTIESKSKILVNASSGKGKSTLLSILFGIRKDYQGNVLFDNQDIKNFNQEDWSVLRTHKIATVFQDLQLFPNLSVKENLLLKNRLTNHKTEEELFSYTKSLKIDDKWNQKCGKLSMGQQQRVAIIRAISQPFEWLFLDEPFSHLDNENAQLAFTLLLSEVKEQNAGLLLSSLGDHLHFQFDKELKL